MRKSFSHRGWNPPPTTSSGSDTLSRIPSLLPFPQDTIERKIRLRVTSDRNCNVRKLDHGTAVIVGVGPRAPGARRGGTEPAAPPPRPDYPTRGPRSRKEVARERIREGEVEFESGLRTQPLDPRRARGPPRQAPRAQAGHAGRPQPQARAAGEASGPHARPRAAARRRRRVQLRRRGHPRRDHPHAQREHELAVHGHTHRGHGRRRRRRPRGGHPGPRAAVGSSGADTSIRTGAGHSNSNSNNNLTDPAPPRRCQYRRCRRTGNSDVDGNGNIHSARRALRLAAQQHPEIHRLDRRSVNSNRGGAAGPAAPGAGRAVRVDPQDGRRAQGVVAALLEHAGAGQERALARGRGHGQDGAGDGRGQPAHGHAAQDNGGEGLVGPDDSVRVGVRPHGRPGAVGLCHAQVEVLMFAPEGEGGGACVNILLGSQVFFLGGRRWEERSGKGCISVIKRMRDWSIEESEIEWCCAF